MTRTLDVAVAGMGAMGSAALRALSRRGLRVAGFDRFAPPHAFGSSHGETRIIREAYFEHPAYVPMVQRAWLLWKELEREARERDPGARLLLESAGLMLGPPDGELVTGALKSAIEHSLPHERIDAAEVARRVPALVPGSGMVGVWEPRAGVLFPEQCIAAFLETARRHRAELHADEPVLSWRPEGAGVEIRTARGRYLAGRLVLAAGAWLPRLLPDLALPLEVERVPLFWFEPRSDAALFDAGRFPIFILEHERDRFIYGFPRIGDSVKLARHHEGEPVDPDRVRREVGEEEVAPLREVLARHLPAANGPLRASAACMYTNTPDRHFVIDAHPTHSAVTIVSACSGHGFKFAPTIGEIVSDLLVEGFTRWDLGLFGIGRFAPAGLGKR